MKHDMSTLLLLGDQTAIDIWIPPNEIIDDLKQFDDKWSKYNSNKPDIKRDGLCIINEDGINKPGPALESLLEWNKNHGTNYTELDFNVSTPVYNNTVLNHYLDPIRQWCFRSHFLRLPPGGYFPPHRDHTLESFRMIIPVENCNPPNTRFLIENDTLHWEMGRLYVVNTIKEHTLFNCTIDLDSIWLVLNVEITDDSVDWVYKNLCIT